ncbi:hypothetical protein [Methylobacterium planeticum]|uniref:PRC-barrel domain containing protein n=1 Tax=Methylobacterium planeticum TaxID=2615211 RepID=A0A6N6MUK0_9HYPH|nr:hypothetical protein [Methylobacterium planeticum]KAB1072489.1 hypothetical protein F6X51_16030 [Methylobacterium planeticum]
MSVRQPGSAASVHWPLLAVAVGAPGMTSASAQPPVPLVDVQANAFRRIVSGSQRRMRQHGSVHTADGHLAGRLRAIRLSPDGIGERAIIQVRPRLGGGWIGVPLHHLERRQGRVVVEADGTAIQRMRRLDRAAEVTR